MNINKHAGKWSVLACALLAANLAHADEEFANPAWADSAWYLGAGIGRSQASIDRARIMRSLSDNGASSVAFSADEKSSAFQLILGKQLSRHFALEAGYFDLGHFQFDAATTPLGALHGKLGVRGGNLDLLTQLPMTERFSVLARLGLQYAKSNASFSGNRLNAVTMPSASARQLNPKLGLGLEYKLSEALAMRVEAERFRINDAVGNRGDLERIGLSLVYKLGRPPARVPMSYQVAEPVFVPVVAAAAAPAPAMPAPPPPPAPVTISEKLSFAAKALFDFDKALLKPEGKAALDEMLAKLGGLDLEVMVAVGFTDSVGSDAYNQNLSQRRADAVKAYLVSRGLSAERVFTEGKGETAPVADNTTAAGRAANRRVTVEVVGTRTSTR